MGRAAQGCRARITTSETGEAGIEGVEVTCDDRHSFIGAFTRANSICRRPKLPETGAYAAELILKMHRAGDELSATNGELRADAEPLSNAPLASQPSAHSGWQGRVVCVVCPIEGSGQPEPKDCVRFNAAEEGIARRSASR